MSRSPIGRPERSLSRLQIVGKTGRCRVGRPRRAQPSPTSAPSTAAARSRRSGARLCPTLSLAALSAGNNLNQIARWVNTHAAPIDAVEIIANPVYISHTLDKLTRVGGEADDAR